MRPYLKIKFCYTKETATQYLACCTNRASLVFLLLLIAIKLHYRDRMDQIVYCLETSVQYIIVLK